MSEPSSFFGRIPGPVRFVAGAAIMMVVAGFGMGMLSRKSSAAGGLQQGALADGPSSPNWAGSETDDAHPRYVAPFAFEGDSAEAWKAFVQIMRDSGGEVQKQDDLYVHAVFTTPFFRFRDDVEARMDMDAKVIHIRSASRLGHSDFGANIERVSKIRAVWVARK